MLPLRRMPSAKGDALRALYLRRLRDGLIVCADASRAEYPIHPGFRPEWGCRSIVWVRNGREEYHFPDADRRLIVDDDVYLVIDAASRYSYRLRSLQRTRCLMVSFPGWMEHSVRRVLTDDLDEDREPPKSWELAEHLAPHDEVVSPELRRIEAACVEGIVGPEWYRQQTALLLTRIVEAEDRGSVRLGRLSELRLSTRRELARRVAMATDCIHESYRQALDLEALAKAAELSPFHFLRVFRAVHGMTPQEYLQRKRVVVAKRLQATTRLSMTRIASLVGFRSRSSLYRWMRRADGLEASGTHR